MVSAYWMVAGAGFEPTTFGLWARRATELLYPAIYNSAVFYSFIIIALCKGCVNSFLHIFLFYALSGFFDWIYLQFNLSFLRVCTQLYGGTDVTKRFKCLLKQKWDCAKQWFICVLHGGFDILIADCFCGTITVWFCGIFKLRQIQMRGNYGKEQNTQ